MFGPSWALGPATRNPRTQNPQEKEVHKKKVDDPKIGSAKIDDNKIATNLIFDVLCFGLGGWDLGVDFRKHLTLEHYSFFMSILLFAASRCGARGQAPL